MYKSPWTSWRCLGVNIASDNSKRRLEIVDISRIDQETGRSFLLKPREKYPTSELLACLGIKSRATAAKYLKYGRRIPDELVARMLENLEEEGFWSLLNVRKTRSNRAHHSKTGKVYYETVMEILKLAIREPILKKMLLEFVSKYSETS